MNTVKMNNNTLNELKDVIIPTRDKCLIKLRISPIDREHLIIRYGYKTYWVYFDK